MCAISMWADRKKFLTTRGAILTGVLLTLWPIVNYIAAVAVVIEGGWGEKEVKW